VPEISSTFREPEIVRRRLPFWSMPIVPTALAAGAGVFADRALTIPVSLSLSGAAACLGAWLVGRRRVRFANVGFFAAALLLMAAWHRLSQDWPANRALRDLATADGTPVRLVAALVAPIQLSPGDDDVLRTMPQPESARLVLDVSQRLDLDGAHPLSGRILAYLPGTVSDLYPGDEIEIQGKLLAPLGPSNPGEANRVQDLRDQGIAAILTATKTADAVRLRQRGWGTTLSGWLGRLQQVCKSTLEQRLSRQSALAVALLLGDGSELGGPGWERFQRSGVIHALAISGQHLVVLAAFLTAFRRGLRLSLRGSTIFLAAILIGYALLAGGRAPIMRAAWVVIAMTIAVFLRRPTPPAATLAVAWIAVLLTNPADAFSIGCQLSFLGVILLRWGVTPLLAPRAVDPLDTLQRELDSPPVRFLRKWGHRIGVAYLANAIVWLGLTPLIAAHFHVVSPIALLIGPPVIVTTSIGLVSGFLLLLTAPILGPLAAPFAWITDASLTVCTWIVETGLRLPGASFYVADVPEWWLGIYVVALLAALWIPMPALGVRVLGAVGGVWLALGLSFGLGFGRDTSPRIAFLAVGHGGCTVIQTSAGRTLVYDAGSMAGPDVTRRVIAPYLWSRGVTRIDELYVSHADLDHFSGVPSLLDRFRVSRVSLTPSFGEREVSTVALVMDELHRRGVPTRIVKSGDEETIDDVRLDVLHPPAKGPPGKENVRSLVMHVRIDSLKTLLTGDLEGEGLDRVLSLRRPELDVLMAPHHGSPLANVAPLAEWARPTIAIGCAGRPRSVRSPAPVYEAVGAEYLSTFDHGAVILRVIDGAWTVTTYRTTKNWRLTAAGRR
jgi:competence protein ComEC